MTQAMDATEPSVTEAELLPPGGLPLGPGSLTWELFGDVRMLLQGPRAAVLQNMLPSLGQGVEDHSVWFRDTINRLQRSVPPIFRTVYGPDPTATGHDVRDFHKHIKGTLPDSSERYHALNPHTYYWAHACFVDSMVTATQTFVRELSPAELDQIIAEHVTWYDRYGVGEPQIVDGGIPRTWAQFQAYFDHMLDEELVKHRTAAYGLGYTTKGWPKPRKLNPLVWKAIRRPLNAVSASISLGGMPPRGREVLELPWDDARERRYRRFASVVRALDPAIRRLPRRMRMAPIPARAFAREGRR